MSSSTEFTNSSSENLSSLAQIQHPIEIKNQEEGASSDEVREHSMGIVAAPPRNTYNIRHRSQVHSLPDLKKITSLSNEVLQNTSREVSPQDFMLTVPKNSSKNMGNIFNTLFLNGVKGNVEIHSTYVFGNSFNSREGAKEKEEELEDVTEELIKDLNAKNPSKYVEKKSQQLIEKMRRMGGVDPLEGDEILNIPSARKRLCLLAGLEDEKYKLFALNSLLLILKHDRHDKPSASQLVSLAIEVMARTEKDLIQMETIDVQRKIAELYSILTEDLHIHYGKGYINGISKALKEQLVRTVKALGGLNTSEDIDLKYNVKCATQGMIRLHDDAQELFILVNRIINFVMIGTGLFMNEPDKAFKRLESVCAKIHPSVKSSWYSAVIIIKNLARELDDKLENLMAVQIIISKKYKELNWKFTYASVLTLFKLSMHGKTEAIRFRAFNGIKQLGDEMPGFSFFINCDSLPIFTNKGPMKHLKLPVEINPNIYIRRLCARCLHELITHAMDDQIKSKSYALLLRQRSLEKNEGLQKYLDELIGSLSLPS